MSIKRRVQNYTQNELEQISEKLLQSFDAERLEVPKPIDVYEVIETCLNVPYDWKYITPDQSILGLSFIKAGYYWIWPKPYYEPGMLPKKMYFEQGTILIDNYLTEQADRGRENFTVMHEVFHSILHKDFFLNNSSICYALKSLREHPDPRSGLGNRSDLEICEFQANFCASCFLMPRKPVTEK